MPEVTEHVDAEQLEAMRCPRCGAEAVQRFYGPCPSCRDELAATMVQRGEKSATAGAFVPKANVVANHVATKD